MTCTTSPHSATLRWRVYLAAELDSLGHAGRVTLYDGIDQFIVKTVDATLQKAAVVIEAIRTKTYHILDPETFIARHIDEIEDAASAALSEMRFRLRSKSGYDVVTATLVPPLAVHHVTHVDAYHTDATMLAVSIQFEASAVVEAQIELDLFDSGPPFYESAAIRMLFAFTGALLIDEGLQMVIEATFTCRGIDSEREPSPSFVISAFNATP